MKVKCFVLFTILVTIVGCRQMLNLKAVANGKEGHFDKNGEWVANSSVTVPTEEQWEDVLNNFNPIPKELISFAEKDLYGIISTDDCYKFCSNVDTSKFMAVFIHQKPSPSFENLVHYGRVVQSYYQNGENDSIQFYGYVLWGLKFKDSWCFYKDEEQEFWRAEMEQAKQDYLYAVLSAVDFFSYNFIHDDEFWQSGGKSKVFTEIPKNSPVFEKYIGFPEIIAWYEVGQNGRRNQFLNEELELEACSIHDSIWNQLNNNKPEHYKRRHKGQYSEKYCKTLYNSERNTLLLPMLYFDEADQCWLCYYVVKLGELNQTYLWSKVSAKQVMRSENHSLEVVYDIRTFIPNWQWGTNNMIQNEAFWLDNFKESDLK